MAKLIILGTANAVPSPGYENTHLAIQREGGIALIDCPGNPINRLEEAGLDLFRVDHILLTHFHPDHVSGTPSFIMQSWLMGRKDPLHIYGLSFTIERVTKMMELFEWEKWPGMYPVIFHILPEQELFPFFEDSEIRLSTSPVHHLLPTVGMRCDFILSNRSLAYSCDTQPCMEVVTLAKDTDLLLHEATGEHQGHSSALQAGQIAAQANTRHLVLIHYPTRNVDYPGDFIQQAGQAFPGSISLAANLMSWEF